LKFLILFFGNELRLSNFVLFISLKTNILPMTEVYTLNQIETELKKRRVYPYQWGKKQNQADDKQTDFIYSILYFEDVCGEIERKFKQHPDYEGFKNYALNRWYNFWSAVAVEKIFAQSTLINPAENPQDRLVDFELKGIPFDHKSSVFPKAYPQSLAFARQNPQHLIEWLYKNQSQENRKHFKNRLFIIFYATEGEHWHLKAEINWIKTLIETYLQNFKFAQLLKIQLQPQQLTMADVIWAIQEPK
jgi:hypothetical protein